MNIENINENTNADENVDEIAKIKAIEDQLNDPVSMKIVEYRISGMSFREIAKRLNISRTKAFYTFKKFLSSPFTQNTKQIDDYRQIDLERTENIIHAFYEEMKNGDPKSAKIILQALERRAKYLSLDDNLPRSDLKGVVVNVITKSFSQPETQSENQPEIQVENQSETQEEIQPKESEDQNECFTECSNECSDENFDEIFNENFNENSDKNIDESDEDLKDI